MKDFYKLLIDFDGNHYQLASVASKRALHIVNSNVILGGSVKPAVRALYEVLSGEVEIVDTEAANKEEF